MNKISVLVPCWNEQENVIPLAEAIVNEFQSNLPQYDYEIIFIDNCSQDTTREKLFSLCVQNKKIKAIFNSKNFGQFNSPYYGLCQTSGDCAILMCADFQDPVEMIPKFVAEWERGFKLVCAIKETSKENKLMYLLRSFYYKTIKRMSDVEQIEHFTGFGLYDKSFIQVLRDLDDPTPFLRGIVAELGSERKDIPYEQAKRRAGITSNNWYRLYDAAMLSFTSYTKIGLRLATILGFIASGISMLVVLIYLVLKLIYWDRFLAGTAPIIIGVFFMGSIQLFFIGLVGEYIMNINTRIMKRPLVIEKKRINFEDKPNVEKIYSNINEL
ncbi:MAG: glycosyltransferase family 2 protein [Desulfosporosinus sp.]|nr:glycosyltransferase family 2 protein [Desulfosporosinus sp.]